jgi:pilus assembly protein CpaE
VQLEERLYLLAAEEPLETDPAPTETGMVRLLDQLRLRFNTIVVDLPHPPGPMERQVMAYARHRLVVAKPDLVSLRNARQAQRMLSTLQGTGLTLTIANRMGAKGALPVKLVEQALGAAPDILVPDLPAQLPQAANLGKPAVRSCAGFRKALAPLVQELSGTRATAGPSLLARLRGRA